MAITLYTIGFTQTTAEHFFHRLRSSSVRRVLDTRLNRGGQLSGFAKDADLSYFLESLTQASYEPAPLLAPTADILNGYRKKLLSWEEYSEAYEALLAKRSVESLLPPSMLNAGCLLCSEATPHRCHRRVAAEYLRKTVDADMVIVHL